MSEATSSHESPRLERDVCSGITLLTDPVLRRRWGVVVAFSERTGGVSAPPFDSLNLAAHVGDNPGAVDENRRRVLTALDLEGQVGNLITSEQVHGNHISVVDDQDAGRGSTAACGLPPVPATDALLTLQVGLPLLMCYADCVPIVLVAPGATSGVAVVHAGWRGALAGLPGATAEALAEATGSASGELLAYVGPHIGPCCYNVDEERMSLFRNSFDTIAAVGEGLDLAAAVREDLEGAGLPPRAIVEAARCTSDHAERFFSYRAAESTGRHGAIAAIV